MGKTWEGPDAAASRLKAARLRRQQAAGASAPEAPGVLERAMARGGAGERRTRQLLAAWSEQGAFAVLNTVVLPEGDADHVTVGAAGVTVIDTKCWAGPVNVYDEGVRSSRRFRSKHVDGLARQVRFVREALDAAGLAAVPVRGALCFVEGNEGTLVDELLVVARGRLRAGRPRPVLGFAGGPGPCDRATASAVVAALCRAFVVRETGPVPVVFHPTAVPRERPAPPRPAPSRRPGARTAAPASRGLRAHGASTATVPAAPRERPARSRTRRRSSRGLAEAAAALALCGALAYGLADRDAPGERRGPAGAQPAPVRVGAEGGRAVGERLGSLHERSRDRPRDRRPAP